MKLVIAVPAGLVNVSPPTALPATALPASTRSPISVPFVAHDGSTTTLVAVRLLHDLLSNTVPSTVQAYEL